MTAQHFQPTAAQKRAFDALYRRYHHPDYLGTDPLGKVLAYTRPEDRELVGLLAAGLSYGQVTSIRASTDRVLTPMGDSPHSWLLETPPRYLRTAWEGFRHRWTSGDEVADLMIRVRRLLQRRGTLGGVFREGVVEGVPDILPALDRWVLAVGGPEHRRSSLLAAPSSGSACKRMLLYLRWMLRRDAVDPGCWFFPGSERLLIVPLDTHMHRLALAVGMADRRQADQRTALLITESFRQWSPGDPVRFDFALTRLGILRADDQAAWIRALRGEGRIPRDPGRPFP